MILVSFLLSIFAVAVPGFAQGPAAPGDPAITVTDASGNTTTQTCYVPPIPK